MKNLLLNILVLNIILIQINCNDTVNETSTLMSLPITPRGMALIPSKEKTFTMGTDNILITLDVESPAHNVSFTYNFWMDTVEVTSDGYRDLMADSKYGYPNVDVPKEFYNGHPAMKLSWYEAALYCNARSKRDGLDTVYKYTAILGNAGENLVLENASFDLTKIGYRMPTEAEWEFAYYGGVNTTFFWGEDTTESIVSQYVWYYNNSEDDRKRGGVKLPNGYGLYDMNGNVSEMTNDYFTMYTEEDLIDPAKLNFQNDIIIRGGDYNTRSYHLYPILRRNIQLDDYRSKSGIRCVVNEEIPESWR